MYRKVFLSDLKNRNVMINDNFLLRSALFSAL